VPSGDLVEAAVLEDGGIGPRVAWCHAGVFSCRPARGL
jgi:hypothetical protein